MSARANRLRRFYRQQAGASAVEFALVGPVFMLLLVGVVEFSAALYNKFALNGSVSAAANYAILNAAQVGADNGASLAQTLAQIVANGHGPNWANATVTVNNGPIATLSGGVVTASGTPANANACYCPTPAGAGVALGSSTTCGAVCASGGIAGKFVSIVATSPYASVFGASGVLPTQVFTTGAVVETR